MTLATWLGEAMMLKALLLAPMARAKAAPPVPYGVFERVQGPLPAPLQEAPVQTAPDTPPTAASEEPDDADDPVPGQLKAPRTPEVAARMFGKYMRETLPDTWLFASEVWAIYRDWSERIDQRMPMQYDNDLLSALVKLPGVRKEQIGLRGPDGRLTGERRRRYTFGDPKAVVEEPVKPARRKRRRRR